MEDDILIVNDINNLPVIVKDIIDNYCIDNDINQQDIYPSIWNDIITEIYTIIFKVNPKLLKLVNSKYNEYDKDKVLFVYNNIYKRICNKHCQEISIKGFLDMTGIDHQSIYNWKDGKNLSSTRFDLHEKIMADNEESLFALMKDRRNNPMKYLPKLNKVHNWNMPGVKAAADNIKTIGAEGLKELATINQEKIVQIEQKNDIEQE